MKKCNKCEEELTYDKFYKLKTSKDGYGSQCKECRKEKIKEYREKNKEIISTKEKVWRENNKEHLKDRRVEYYEKNKESVLEKNKKYRDNNKEKISTIGKNWREKNKEKVKENRRKWLSDNPDYNKDYMKEYVKNSDEYYRNKKEYRTSERGRETKNEWTKNDKLKNPHIYAWRTTLNNSLKRLDTEKSSSTLEMLGYSADELKEHIESLFTDGMSWDNHGEWHIDHIKPVSLFDPETDVSIVNSLENLQPLWSVENLSKGNSYNT